MIHLGISISTHDLISREILGTVSAVVHVGDVRIHSQDPDHLDRLARELSSAAESLRLARIASIALSA